MTRTTISLDEFHAQLKAQKVPSRRHVAMKCPVCGTVQSMDSLIRAGAGPDEDSVEKFVGFSCVGRWTMAGPHKPGTPPGRGCNWTLGGLFAIHNLEVATPDGKVHPSFEAATPEEAQELHRSIYPEAVSAS